MDFLKRVNDFVGQDKDEIISRIGGEEFVLVLPNEDSQSAFKIAERLRKTVESTEMDTIGFITISIGISTWPEHSNDIDQVYKCADKALYHAKEHGRNQCIVADIS
ncbi:GGDEF domain-containing protein [Pseudoalteromonas distincta]|uniref:GGDEF domain-containing protein n=1 Tax=Pseudoalteromonas distincta TaxID=77608 RepID=UPI003F8B9FFA